MSAVQDHLDQFYIELQAWIDGGCGEHRAFSRRAGLCANLNDWCLSQSLSDDVWDEVSGALADSFDEAELHDVYPFNSRGFVDYASERSVEAVYTNPARLAWIKEHAEAALARRAGGEVAA